MERWRQCERLSNLRAWFARSLRLRPRSYELRNDMREDHREMREDHRQFNTRLRNVEIEFGKVEQRLETPERAVLPQAPAAP